MDIAAQAARQRGHLAAWLATALLVSWASAGCSPSNATDPKLPLPQRTWHPRASQWLPRDAQWTARISWARVGKHPQQFMDALLSVGMTKRLATTLLRCSAGADTVWLAGRLGPHGLDGDLLASLAFSGDSPRPTSKCVPAAWHSHQGPRGRLYSPTVTPTQRDALAQVVLPPNQVLVFQTPGMLDAWSRLQQSGPEPPTPSADSDLVDVTVRPPLPAPDWLSSGQHAPTWLSHVKTLRVRLQQHTPLRGRVSLAFVSAADAADAGTWLTKLRDRLLKQGKPPSVTRSIHARLRGTVLTVTIGPPAHAPPGAQADAPPNPGRHAP